MSTHLRPVPSLRMSGTVRGISTPTESLRGSGVAQVFWRRERVITMAAPNTYYEP